MVDGSHHREVVDDEGENLDTERHTEHGLHVAIQKLQRFLLSLHDRQHIRVLHVLNILCFDVIHVVLIDHPDDLRFDGFGEHRLVHEVFKRIEVFHGVRDIVHINQILDTE